MSPSDLDVSNETGFYPSICERLKELVLDRCPKSGCQVVTAYGSSLVTILGEIERQAGRTTPYAGIHVPVTHPDILLGALDETGFSGFCLVEVKWRVPLNLVHYSQLLGYLMTARKFQAGLLVLVTDDFTPTAMSSELASLLADGDLPMQVKVQTPASDGPFYIKTGIATYTPGDGMDFIPTGAACGGFHSFRDVAAMLWPE